MNPRFPITHGAGVLLGVSALLAGLGFALPHLARLPAGPDRELTALRSERDLLVPNSDNTLADLRRQAKGKPRDTWSVEQFTAQVGTGWRVEWQHPDGPSRAALLSRSAPRLPEWPEYVRFAQSWTTEPGIVFESLDVVAKGPAHAREFTHVVIGLRVVLADAPMSDAERAAPSRAPLPVAPAAGPAMPRKVGAGPSLRPPATSAKPPADEPGSTSSRPDPPGPWAGVYPMTPPINPNPT